MKIFQNLFLVSLISFSAVVAKPKVVQSDIFYEISKGNVSAVRAWLKTKPDLTIENGKGQTLLGAAVFANKRSVVQALVKAGANVNALDSAKKTALDHAVESDNVKMAATLAKCNARVTTMENMYRFKDLMRNYSIKLFIRAFIIGLVSTVALWILGSACPIFWGGCPCYSMWQQIALLSVWGAVNLYSFVLDCKAISWNRAANRFDGLLADAVVEPAVILEK